MPLQAALITALSQSHQRKAKLAAVMEMHTHFALHSLTVPFSCNLCKVGYF